MPVEAKHHRSWLLDTQVMIWLLQDDARLASDVRARLVSRSQPAAVSYFSLMEVAIKTATGKLGLTIEQLTGYLQELAIDVVPAETITLRGYSIYNPLNRDPFDNLIMTVARQQGWTLVTSDQRILAAQVEGLRLLDSCGSA